MNLKYENQLIQKGYKFIAGVDEAGRGPLAGPVFAATVILPIGFDVSEVNDSKKLSEAKREELFEKIINATSAYSIISMSAKVIDKIGILTATKRAMQRAIKNLNPSPDFIMLDGINVNIPDIPQIQIIGGDSKVASIAAASILAKVSRDRFMYKMHKKYPQYNFDKHKGYGTKEHMEVIKKAGATPIHRKSFAPLNRLKD